MRSIALAVLMLAALPARAEEWVGNPILEPLALPEQNVAVQRAQQTLVEAGKLVSAELDGRSLPRMGFNQRSFKLGELSFKNASAVYRKNAAGQTVHLGYTFEMRAAGDHSGPAVPVVIGRRGRIAQRLFSGQDSLFAQAGEVDAALLDPVLRKDLKSDQPLDLVSRANARRQAQLGNTKPYKLGAGTPKPLAPKPVVTPTPPPAQKLKLRDRLRILVKGR